jgi:glyoxylase-like metal-dependent hydrolase (beta-lactamase superfamily II)
MLSDSAGTVSRRSFLRGGLMLAAAPLLRGRFLSAEGIPTAEQIRADGRTAKVTTSQLRRNLWVLAGAGGNIIVLPGPDGKLLIDAGYATCQSQITQALLGINSNPIKHLVDTHWHFDHTDGNAWIHGAGATIIAHDNTLKRLGTRQEIPAFAGTFPPSPAGALPTVVFSSERNFGLNGEQIQLEHYSPAHSDSDISVRFAAANVLHTGDTWFNGFYPFIDYHNGGTLQGMLMASARNVQRVNDDTIIVPGHGPVGDKSNLLAYDRMLNAVHERVAGLKRRGRSLSETIAAKPSAEFDSKWGGGWIGPGTFVELVYTGVPGGDAK